MCVSAHRVVSSHCNTQRSLGARGTLLLEWIASDSRGWKDPPVGSDIADPSALPLSSETTADSLVCYRPSDGNPPRPPGRCDRLFQEALSFNDAAEISNHG